MSAEFGKLIATEYEFPWLAVLRSILPSVICIPPRPIRWPTAQGRRIQSDRHGGVPKIASSGPFGNHFQSTPFHFETKTRELARGQANKIVLPLTQCSCFLVDPSIRGQDCGLEFVFLVRTTQYFIAVTIILISSKFSKKALSRVQGLTSSLFMLCSIMVYRDIRNGRYIISRTSVGSLMKWDFCG